VIVEAAMVGLIAAAGGYLLGQALAALAAYGLRFVDDTAPRTFAVGFSLPAALAALAVGLVVAVLAAVLPARSATRVAPIRALSEQGELIESRRIGWFRFGSGLLLLAAGLALAAYSAGRHKPEPGIVGGLLAMLALLALGPVVVGPMARFVGWPGRLAGAAGRLAASNGARQPRRTAAAINALTLGIGLVTVMLVGAASLQKTADVELNGAFPVDYRVSSSAPQPNPYSYAPLPAGLAGALGQRSEFQPPVSVRRHRAEDVRTPGATLGLDVVGVDPGQMPAHVPDAAFGPGSVVLTKGAADQLGHATAGQTLTVQGTKLKIAAVVKGGFESPFGGLTLTSADFAKLFGAGPATEILLWKKNSVDAAASRAALDAAIAQLPDVNVQDLAENRGEITSEIDTLLAAGGLLVAMAMVVAVLGVMITLTLSVLERRREIAVLRALGLTRGQLYTTLTLEGAIMAVLAAVLGASLGLAFGIAGTYAALGSQDGLQIAVPVGRIALVLVAAALVGMLAALPPGRRASRTAPVAALATA
jgi:putative ABC transport system permease protein